MKCLIMNISNKLKLFLHETFQARNTEDIMYIVEKNSLPLRGAS